jgi:hypothetical protein
LFPPHEVLHTLDSFCFFSPSLFKMRFALFALVAALTIVSVAAFTPITHPINEAPPTFNSLANGKAPSTQTIGFINGMVGKNLDEVSATVSMYNTTTNNRGATKAFATLTAPYGSWVEKTLGADVNYPVSINVNSTQITTSSLTLNDDNLPTTATGYHYSFGVAGLYSGNPYALLQAISDASFVTYVNSNSSLMAFINLLDIPGQTSIYMQCKTGSSVSTPFPVNEASQGFSWQQQNAGSSSGQCRVLKDSDATKAPLIDYTDLSIQNNALMAFVITGTQGAGNATFPLKVTVGKSASQTGSPASTVAVSFALMALLAILAFATPALF